MKRSLLAVMAVMVLAAAAPALAQEEPDTPVSGRPGQGSATPSDFEALQATGADIDCGILGSSETGSEAQYADDAQYGGGSSVNSVSDDAGSAAGDARVLPETGGSALLPLGTGALLIGSGLLCRRLVH